MRRVKWILVYLFSASWGYLSAQDTTVKSYLILSIDDLFSKSFEGAQHYYWILPVESNSEGKNFVGFSPLWLQTLPKSKLESCCKGIEIDPWIEFRNDTEYLGRDYSGLIETIKKVIAKKRKIVKRVKQEWPERNSEERTEFYITPVTGVFCASTLAKSTQSRTEFRGTIYLPKASVHWNANFEETDQIEKLIRGRIDQLNYKAVPNQ